MNEEPGPKKGPEQNRPSPSCRVLIADDEFLIRWSLAEALSHEGYEVVAVEDGQKAIEATNVQPFDFIITDLVMPEADGWQVLEKTRGMFPQPRVIIITAHGQEELKRTAKERGAWAYIEKPQLIENIKALLKKSLK
jgi:DNA-binding NtrC family response regulator